LVEYSLNKPLNFIVLDFRVVSFPC
jgi:hypothetical protein